MRENVIVAYRTYESFKDYGMSNKRRVKEIRKLYNLNKEYFGKSILDIACGGGILGFVIEPLGMRYTGVDINPDMIREAKGYSKSIRSPNKFLLKDITKSRIPGKYDTITFIGNGLGHLTTGEFLEALKNMNAASHKGTYLIIDYRDMVYMIANGLWKDRYKGETHVSISLGADTLNGEMRRGGHMLKGNKKIKVTHTIWAPFIIEPLLKSQGWNLIKRKQQKRWNGWLDIYKRL